MAIFFLVGRFVGTLAIFFWETRAGYSKGVENILFWGAVAWLPDGVALLPGVLAAGAKRWSGQAQTLYGAIAGLVTAGGIYPAFMLPAAMGSKGHSLGLAFQFCISAVIALILVLFAAGVIRSLGMRRLESQ